MTPRVRGTGQFPAQGLYPSWGVREPRARTRRRDGVRGWGRQGVCAAHPPRSPWKWTLAVTGGHGRPPSQKEPKKPPVQTEGPGGDPMALSVQDGLSKGCRERAPPSHPSLRASGPGSLGDQAVTCQAGRKPQVGCLGIREAPGPAFQRRSPPPPYLHLPAWRCPAGAGGWKQDRWTEICVDPWTSRTPGPNPALGATAVGEPKDPQRPPVPHLGAAGRGHWGLRAACPLGPKTPAVLVLL